MNKLPHELELLNKLNDSGLKLHQHQIEGIEKILQWYKEGHGGILADEMGLGKTCQTICSLVILSKKCKNFKNSKFMILCPLSVIEHWENEVIRFGCNVLKLFVYKGEKETRHSTLESRLKNDDWNVLLTTYSLFRIDYEYMNFPVDIFIVDEAHSVKNQMSTIHQLVRQKNAIFHILLTGTPIQNDLGEFYSLLSIVDSDNFYENDKERFLTQDKDVLIASVKKITENYVLRRLKSTVCQNIPPMEEVILKHGLTKFQKDLYNAILVNNREFFEITTAPKQSLMGQLFQLRKAVSHPYLFPGVEPEPFTEGEHLFTSSGKFMVIDKLLQFLKKKGHRCLIFSQFAKTLEILSDALNLRGYNYEHFDGSTKAENRFQSIDNFQRNNSNIFCFLISTKAGGQGLTLTGADTVIFVDSDFNPQNDLQAAARCHRIGQDKPVKIIRLFCEHTIDDAIYKRSKNKLKLSEFVLEDNKNDMDTKIMKQVLLSDLAKLNQKEDTSEEIYSLLTDDYFIQYIGETDENNHWICDQNKNDKVDEENDEEDVELFPTAEPIVQKLSSEDEAIFNNLIKKYSDNNDVKLQKAIKSTPSTSKTQIDPEEAAERRKQRMLEAKAKREAEDKRREEEKKKKWEENYYESHSIEYLMKNKNLKITSKNLIPGRLYRVFGNIVNPVRSSSDKSSEAWILHSVDKGGHWGNGGLFTIIQNLSEQISKAYETAGEMDDLYVGDSHFLERLVEKQESEAIPINPEIDLDEKKKHKIAPEKLKRKLCFLLMVTQSLRDRHRFLMPESGLRTCFKNIAEFAKTRSEMPSIHMANIWWRMSNLTENIVCDMIVKYLCKEGIDVYIYQYRRHQNNRKGNVVSQPLNLKQASPVKKSNQQRGPPSKKRKVEIVSDEESEEEEELSSEEEEEEEFDTETESEEEESEIFLSDDEEDDEEEEEE